MPGLAIPPKCASQTPDFPSLPHLTVVPKTGKAPCLITPCSCSVHATRPGQMFVCFPFIAIPYRYFFAGAGNGGDSGALGRQPELGSPREAFVVASRLGGKRRTKSKQNSCGARKDHGRCHDKTLFALVFHLLFVIAPPSLSDSALYLTVVSAWLWNMGFVPAWEAQLPCGMSFSLVLCGYGKARYMKKKECGCQSSRPFVGQAKIGWR